MEERMPKSTDEWKATVVAPDNMTVTATFDAGGGCVAFEVRAAKGERLTATSVRVPFRIFEEQCRRQLLVQLGADRDVLAEQLAEGGIDVMTSTDPRAEILRLNDAALLASAGDEVATVGRPRLSD